MVQAKWNMKDLLVILPGITGSVLVKKGFGPIWAPAPQMISSCLFSLGHAAEHLALKDHDPSYDDGVEATELVPFTLVPGLARFDGYTGLKKALFDGFRLTVGRHDQPDGAAANYFEFPYDWRRDNRATAARLKALIDRELPKWRSSTDDPKAKVVFLAHSMGGLVARYYIEVLEGFANTKALITFGTPYRGSVEAIDYFANGYVKFGLQLQGLTAALRTLPSMYQLLPRYPAVWDRDHHWKRVFEVKQPIDHLSRAAAKAAYENLYCAIDEAYERNRHIPEYEVELLPVFGWGQQTAQSASINSVGTVTISGDFPPSVDPVFANGDGTVPRVSAIPIELNDKPLRWWGVNQKHATLQNHKELIANLTQNLAALQGELKRPARAVGAAEAEKGIEVQVDELFAAGEPVTVRVRTSKSLEPTKVVAVIEQIAGESAGDFVPREIELKQQTDDRWVANLTDLPAGSFRIGIAPGDKPDAKSEPVTEIFAVA